MKYNKTQLIGEYQEQLKDCSDFKGIILKEAIRKLKESPMPAIRINNWVISLIKAWDRI